MLKNYCAKSAASGGTSITVDNKTYNCMSVVPTVANNKEGVILSIEVQNINDTSDFIIVIRNNNSNKFIKMYSVDPYVYVVYDNKVVLEAGDSLLFGSDKANLGISVSCDVSDAS